MRQRSLVVVLQPRRCRVWLRNTLSRILGLTLLRLIRLPCREPGDPAVRSGSGGESKPALTEGPEEEMADPGCDRNRLSATAEVLLGEIHRHHDSSVQAQMGASQCNLLLRSHRRALFGSITISESLHMYYEFRGMRPVPLGLYDEVGHLFADENRRHPTSRWQVVPYAGVISFTGELQLRGDPGEDRRLMRRYALRRMEVVHRRLSRMFFQWESRSRARQGACTEKARAAG